MDENILMDKIVVFDRVDENRAEDNASLAVGQKNGDNLDIMSVNHMLNNVGNVADLCTANDYLVAEVITNTKEVLHATLTSNCLTKYPTISPILSFNVVAGGDIVLSKQGSHHIAYFVDATNGSHFRCSRWTDKPHIRALLARQEETQSGAYDKAGNEVSSAIVRPQIKIFHPSSNSCIFRQLYEDSLKLAPCEQTDSWKYTPQKFLTVAGTYYCLKAAGPALPAKLSIACEVSDSQWTPVSGSQKTHLMTEMKDGTSLCLDVGEDKAIVTNPCRSFSSDGNDIENDSQWFQISAFSYKKD
ncbi:hypothetical protein MA16_Dca018129 [Dendrobium catenatum]|uniref:Ricin B lectin domain-containing protein n=1 Tax=Dendrobium catenatum TaxID=906689 RepID=A0A2I0WHC1_9ASPA|nr:hypothetical protein MA16_Dca018129 [Dendrobium catenatum]